MFISEISVAIKEKARELGFADCGFSKAEALPEDALRLKEWLDQGHHARMAYMANHFEKRTDPTQLVEGAQSVISLLYNYYSDKRQTDPEAPVISKYAYGKDYHVVIKEKLKLFLKLIQEEIGEVRGRAFVDSAPVMDKAWAARSGLGWIGKHTNLINKQSGSYFFIAELILDLELESDGPVKDFCGTCTRCIDACPTDAIAEPYVVDGSRCISYFTIELKEEIPVEVDGKFKDWIFGCDICQDVCPWNRFSKPHREPDFEPNGSLKNMNKKEWEEITEEVFQQLFKHSPVKRTKFEGLKRNIKFVK